MIVACCNGRTFPAIHFEWSCNIYKRMKITHFLQMIYGIRDVLSEVRKATEDSRTYGYTYVAMYESENEVLLTIMSYSYLVTWISSSIYSCIFHSKTQHVPSLDPYRFICIELRWKRRIYDRYKNSESKLIISASRIINKWPDNVWLESWSLGFDG